MEKTVVVTGVSTGIGRATADVLAAKGWRVFGTVRKTADAEALRAEGRIAPLIMDVSDGPSVEAAAAELRGLLEGRTLNALVNNAGMAVSGPLLQQDVETFRRQIEVNVVGVFTVTRAFAPLLGADPALQGARGRIVNISSIGGLIAAPFLGAYAASKHAIEGFSDSLRRELQLLDIPVIVVAPGSVATPIWDKAEQQQQPGLAGSIWEKPYRGFESYMVTEGRRGLKPEKVGEIVAEALSAPRPKPRYVADKRPFRNAWVPVHLPKGSIDRAVGKRLGLASATS